MNGLKILLVEDETVLAYIIKESLESRGFNVMIANDGVDGWKMYHSFKPDICIIDVMLPKKDGFALVRDIRIINKSLPIIFLTAKIQSEDVLKGLELGADDYMKKPFSMEELILRIKGLIRRAKTDRLDSDTRDELFSLGNSKFCYKRLEIVGKNGKKSLSQREADLLLLLIKNKNDLLERRDALLKLWGEDNRFNARSMDVYITRLRKFLLNDPSLEILSIRGQGYKLVEILD